jgi:mycothiol synthase
VSFSTSGVGELSTDQAAAVVALVERAADIDGASALNEQQLLYLRRGAPGGWSVLADDEGSLTGFGLIEVDENLPASGALIVDPGRRREGIGRAVVGQLVKAAPGRLQIWAHGNLPGAAVLAAGTGFTSVRELWVLRRWIGGAEPDLPEPRWPDGVVLRTFTVGRDEDEWVGVNAAAFADHPEQGRMRRPDLEERMAEPWFDPAGFFLAERDGRVVGFHWTKVDPHRAVEPGAGEIYVLGIDPTAQGMGLGKALALAGLRHLQDRGVPAVTLYVEADNPAAVGLYAGLGFSHTATDVLYEHAAR